MVFATAKKLLGAVFRPADSATRALRSFAQHRQELREQFFVQAAASGKPRGLRWTECVWLDTYTLVLDADAGMHTLFCGVNLHFEAIAGGDMEDVEAVSMIRDGSAVFHHKNSRWGSGGRVLFNMDPQLAAQSMAHGLPVVKTHDDA